MNTSECFALIESKFDHLFTTDRENNAITLRPGFGNIPPFTLVCVEGGEFIIGENGVYVTEKLPHQVVVSSFFMAEFPVIQELYLSVTGTNPSDFEGVNHPVENVNWYDATVFCNRLNEMLKLPVPYSGKDKDTECNFECNTFRLPTEAEWEYAARGGNSAKIQTEYAGSHNPNDVAWYDKNNGHETKPVGLKFPNRLGLYDMSGNVWEWCWDRYDNNFDTSGSTDNPQDPLDVPHRIMRGGSWDNFADGSHVACRCDSPPSSCLECGGFRILFALQ